MIIIENDDLQVELMNSGAEVQKVIDKHTGKNKMWSGDPEYWGRVSPILFPIVGALKGGTYRYENQMYTLPRHGFLRDQMFVTNHLERSKVRFHFESSGQFTDVYPFEFTIHVNYELVERSLKVTWEVKNDTDGPMYFSIGGHPGFALPMREGRKTADHVIELQSSQQLKQYQLVDNLLEEVKDQAISSSFSLSPERFKRDALVYEGVDKVSVTIDQSIMLELDVQDAPYVGVWSPYREGEDELAFICIEPWYGLADTTETSGSLEEKKGIQKLAVGEQFTGGYTIKF
ncbi:aldose 1-epimerase family protein [Shouchella sp. JSM 1781072]|uniref:aldose 1-epimerase family protein n=1 Tax=Bacillaceae TaxID=186817 RepID=UPI00159BEFBB|nr:MULTISPECIES: aldose 1-epimerase family protein [Bacillaceae]UTR07512.1 aldose 1-epimerase family protein [Alkalihalobacillus sp. LMS6]